MFLEFKTRLCVNANQVPKESANGVAVSFREKIAFSYFVKNMSHLIFQSFAKIPGIKALPR